MTEAQSLTKSISKLANEVRRKTETFSFSKQYSSAQWRTLHFILSADRDIFQKDIEKEFNIRSSSATELLKQMEINGFIRKESVDYDNRLRKIVATEKAGEYREEIFAQLRGLDDLLVRQIPKDKLDIYMEVAQMMMDNLSK